MTYMPFKRRRLAIWAYRDGFFGALIGPIHVRIKTPHAHALFSERNGYDNPILRLWGWRLFIERAKY